MIVAGPCLICNDQREIDNALETARQLQAFDPEIWFRAKLWGGGPDPERYLPGIGSLGIPLLKRIRGLNIRVGTEVQCESRLSMVKFVNDYIWTPARAMQVYGFLEAVGQSARDFKAVIVKRHFGSTQADTWGIHDICEQIHHFKPIICERGVNALDQVGASRWIPDFRFMTNTLRERPDINLMFDPSHAAFNKPNVSLFAEAAAVLGVRNFMFEVYADPTATQADQVHALSVEEFKRIHDRIRRWDNGRD